MTGDIPGLFADVTIKLEDLHATAVEGQRRDNSRDIQRALVCQLCMGVATLGSGLVKIKRKLGDDHG